MFPSCFLLIDPDVLGRPDKDSLPQHTLMEILIGDLDDRTCFRDKEGVFLEACAWSGVKCTADGDVFSINWDPDHGWYLFGQDRPVQNGGSIDLRWMPSSVQDFHIPKLDLSGSVDTFSLPREMTSIDIKQNQFHGPFNIAGLPLNIRSVDVSSNRLCGSLDLPRLPEGISLLNAAMNDFSGSISLIALPESLNGLWLNANRLSGSVDRSALRLTLYHCNLADNAFGSGGAGGRHSADIS
ncbi:leucine-rich repeat protein [Perkinsela sp. CCAP 1560/4]|nr:leucine-rich repeat protein [Perkinsela sp. CCAP 1560/4]|eukprot:KNH07899.1 leucine-rich repeat protein [Perkinsela sp. CCAP 1560/4]